MSENVRVGSFYNYLLSQGYYFDKELIENFLLSLKVKPFLILTGNSGTGKTKLSQLFAQFLRDSNYHMLKVTTKATSWGYSEDKGTDGHDCGWTILKEYREDIIPYEINGIYEIEVGGHVTKAEINVVPQLYYDKHNEEMIEYFKDLYYQEKEQIKKDKSQGVTPDDQLVELGISCKELHSILFDNYVKADEFTIKMNNIKTFLKKGDVMLSKGMYKYTPFKNKLDCKIISNNITSSATFYLKFRMSNYLTDEIKEYLEDIQKKGEKSFYLTIRNFVPIKNFNYNFNNKNYQIVPVGANWTDNTNIVGYNNVITNEYQSTPAYNLIKRALKDENNPYFLILDEMNLSHVERYFSDFLSSIESGETIPLVGNDKSLKLPKNLFIIGTVNVDETTYMFSPKVLDRANVIEFDSLLAMNYMHSDKDFSDFNFDIDYLQSPRIDSDINMLTIDDLRDELSECNLDGNNLWDILAEELTIFQKALQRSGLEFGYRVINEILRFMVVSWRYEGTPKEWDNWERYFDAQIKQKILPKLHGSEKAIGNVLTNLFNICLVDRNNNENPKNAIINKDDCRYYTSALKLKDMAKVLSDQRYVSFIN